MVEKAVILAAGSASRMQDNLERFISDQRELAAVRSGEKMAARFARFPFLDYQMLNLIHAGLTKISIVLGKGDSYFIEHYDSIAETVFPELDISYSFQALPDGTAHAVLAAEAFVKGDRFLVLNGDNNYSSHAIRMLASSPGESSAMVAFDVDGFNRWTRRKLKSFAVVRVSGGRLVEIVEKPENPEEFRTRIVVPADSSRPAPGVLREKDCLLLSMNLWCLQPGILEDCRTVKRHPPRREGKQGEFELPDAIDAFLGRGNEILVYHSCEDVLDLTRAEDIRTVENGIRKNLSCRIDELERRYVRAAV